jgi:hypothetical protein
MFDKLSRRYIPLRMLTQSVKNDIRVTINSATTRSYWFTNSGPVLMA